MQGAFPSGRTLPDHDWLSREWLRSYLLQRDGDRELLDQTELWNHPLLAPWFPDPPVERLRGCGAINRASSAALDALPRTLCHLDLHPANLFGDAGADSTTAIDWSFVGIGAIGEDAGNLVPDAVLDFHVGPAQLDELYETIADGYTAGLRDAGWQGTDSSVRLGMAATIAAKYAWIGPAMLRAVSETRADLNRRAIAESLEWWAPTIAFLLDRADEARASDLTVEDRHDLDVEGVREHVDEGDRRQEEPVVAEQRRVAPEARGVAAHEHEAAGTALGHHCNSLAAEALAARIGHDEVGRARRPFGDVAREDGRVECTEIHPRVAHCGGRRLDRGHRPFPSSSRRWRGWRH